MPLIVRRVRKKKRAVDAPNDALANRGSSSGGTCPTSTRMAGRGVNECSERNRKYIVLVSKTTTVETRESS